MYFFNIFFNIKIYCYMSNYTIKNISKKRLVNNLHIIKSRLNSDCKICAMVKANAYGHGIENVVKCLEHEVDFYGVANLDEALKVKNILKTAKVLIVGRCDEFEKMIKNDISFAIISNEHFIKLINFLHNYALNNNESLYDKTKIHLKINCGMNRFGINKISEFKKIYKNALTFGINIEGVFTHFQNTENAIVFEKQKLLFNRFLMEIPISQIPIVHIGGSGVILNNKNLNYIYPKYKVDYNMVRIGILLYGYGGKGQIKLKKVMKIESKIINILDVKKGEYIGYGQNYKAKNNMKIAVVPVGYGDGLLRAFSKEGYLKVVTINEGKKHIFKCAIVGNICMDATMIDVTNVKNLNLLNKVIIMDNADKMARKLKTIPYEILTNFNKLRT